MKLKKDNVVEFEYTEENSRALELMENTDMNVFLTGVAGSGKSTLLDQFMLDTDKSVIVLAPTGVAAVNVGGQTIHSFFGFGPDIIPYKAKSFGQKKVDNLLYQKVHTIIIDEISMVRVDLLDCVDAFLRAVKKNRKAFGGVQMIFVGDMFQLPPVMKTDDKKHIRTIYKSEFFFDAHAFKRNGSEMETIVLKKIYRQKDSKFIEILNGIRNKTITDKQLKKINKNIDENFGNKDGTHVYLTTTNFMAQKINMSHLQKLKGESKIFKSQINGVFPKNTLPNDEIVTLKIGAKIILTCNKYDREKKKIIWINGTLGTVEEFVDDGVVKVKLDNEEQNIVSVTYNEWNNYQYKLNIETKMVEKVEIGNFIQIPIKLAYSFTIHRAQGKTFEKVCIDLSRGSFAHGQTYVAFSRATSLDGLVLKSEFFKSDIILDDRVNNFFNKKNKQVSMKL